MKLRLSQITLSLLVFFASWETFARSSRSVKAAKKPEVQKSRPSDSDYTLYANPIGMLDGVYQGGVELPLSKKFSISTEFIFNQGYNPEGTDYRLDGHSVHLLPTYYFNGFYQNSFYLTGGPGHGKLYFSGKNKKSDSWPEYDGSLEFFALRIGAGYRWTIEHSDTSVALEIGRVGHTFYLMDKADSESVYDLKQDSRRIEYINIKFGVNL